MKRVGQSLLLWLFVISAAVWATVLLTYLLYPLFIHFEDLGGVAGMSAGRLYHNYLRLMAYLQVPGLSFDLPDFRWSASGAQHFADVKHLFILAIVVFLLTVIPAVRLLARMRRTHTRWLLVRQASVGALVPLLLGVLMAVNFNEVFITFHHLLFRNADWLFDPAVDPIINVLPEEFFAACFALALILFEFAMLWAIVSGRRDARLRQ
ncbi:TIGR01906 family membrane protein [Lacticaseibacillus hegangensis]|uniref:TIGR01906 family membrane protein n=1 Tax=Lacticaseibacillus hegangensis TaxID=2486010 RepID=A0ABW4CXE3_9LACO|nr:TIGR01906 family membrane protein [Lacticaseibacillus hegangensis]